MRRAMQLADNVLGRMEHWTGNRVRIRPAMRRLIAVRSPTMWQVLAWMCRVARSTRIRPASWSARLGHALLHAGRPDEAATAYLEAISEQDPASPTGVSARVRQGHLPPGIPPSWITDLVIALRDLGDVDAAAAVMRAGVAAEPSSGRQLEMLARLEEELGNVARASELRNEIALRRGAHDPRARYLLARSYDRAGRWHDAISTLLDNIEDHPQHAASYRLLAAVASSIATWDGTFTDAEATPSGGRFEFGGALPHRPGSMSLGNDPAELAVNALARAVALQPQRSSWRAALGDALAAAGRPAEAIEQYTAAVKEADVSSERWALTAKQRWQFQLERAWHSHGQSRVDDPLFDVVLSPKGSSFTGIRSVSGLFRARLTYAGLAIEGFVAATPHDTVDVYLNGQLLRKVNIAAANHHRQFSITVKRNALARFPSDAAIDIRTASGDPLVAPSGAQSLRLEIPHGDGTILMIMSDGGRLDKKGEIRPSAADMRRRQDRDLEIYSAVRKFFEQRIGRTLFLLYGTLLGYHRDGDLIPGDDDFDAGYVSDKNDPVAVKQETKEIIVELVREGFTVSFNRKGRLFRVQLDRSETDGGHIDIHPIWFQDGKVWIHNLLAMPSSRDDYLPGTDGTLRAVAVSAPRKPEVFLSGNYGPGWTTPDPGFRYYPSRVDPAILQNLEKALISVLEYNELADRIRREVNGDPRAGRLVSLGSQNLYPLDQFIL